MRPEGRYTNAAAPDRDGPVEDCRLATSRDAALLPQTERVHILHRLRRVWLAFPRFVPDMPGHDRTRCAAVFGYERWANSVIISPHTGQVNHLTQEDP